MVLKLRNILVIFILLFAIFPAYASGTIDGEESDQEVEEEATLPKMAIRLTKFDAICGVTCAEKDENGICIKKEYDEKIYKPGKITGNLVRCMERIINYGGNKLIRNFVSKLSTLVHYAILMALVIWGFRMMFGIGKSRGIVSIMLLKLVFVLYITNPSTVPQLQKWRSGLLDFPKKFSALIINATKNAGNAGAFTISIGDMEYDDVFDSYDEYILHLFGVVDKGMSKEEKEEAYAKMQEENVYFGIAALIGGLFFLGDIGASLTMVGILFVFTVIVAIAQAILIFTTVTIAMNILMALAPLACPCILFDPVKKITLSWAFALVAYTIQPLFLVMGTGLTLGLLDNVVSGSLLGGEAPLNNIYRDVRIKVDQGTGAGLDETTIASCGKMKKAAKAITRAITHQGGRGGMRAMAMSKLTEMDQYSSGIGDPAAFSDLTNNINTGLVQTCNMVAKTISIDAFASEEETEGEVTKEDLQDLQGIQLAVSVMMVMLISFLQQIPKMAHEITKSGSLAPITEVAGGLGDRTRRFTVGDSNSGGLVGFIRTNVNRST